MVELYCEGCGAVRPFEQPPCAECHEPTCPEWLCTRCAKAFLIDPPLPGLRRGGGPTIPYQRRFAA
jgi:hypothetical protein